MATERKRGLKIHQEGFALICRQMREKGLKTYEALGEASGLTANSIGRFMRGTGNPERTSLDAIANALNLDPHDLSDDYYPEQKKRKSNEISSEDIDALVQEVREKVKSRIYQDCGKIKVLDMTQSIGIGDIYTNVNILRKPTRLRGTKIAEQLLAYDPDSDDHARYGLGKVISDEPIPGLKAVQDYQKLMVLGKPGAGKTTFLKHLAIQSISGEVLPDRIPIFVDLKIFAKEKDQPGLELYITQLFFEDGIEPDQVRSLIKQGKALILLDGLDEVRDEDSSHVIRQVQTLADNYDSNQFLITCRIAAHEYSFQGFTDVEVADFNNEQISIFVRKWFPSREQPDLAKSLIQQLENNRSVKELATSPLLLTLLCIEFEDSGDLPSDRISLYDRAIDTLLRKWDKKNNVERDQLYKKLTLMRKQDLLSHIAFVTFERKEYFFKQRDLEQIISDFIYDLQESQTDPEVRLLDSRSILKSIEAQHGLLVERARGVYSFSHLTFHEYFVAYKVSRISNPIAFQNTLQMLAIHVNEETWREVLALTIEMMTDASELILLIRENIDLVLNGDKIIQNLLHWINERTSLQANSFSPQVTRGLYLAVILGSQNSDRYKTIISSDLKISIVKFQEEKNSIYLVFEFKEPNRETLSFRMISFPDFHDSTSISDNEMTIALSPNEVFNSILSTSLDLLYRGIRVPLRIFKKDGLVKSAYNFRSLCLFDGEFYQNIEPLKTDFIQIKKQENVSLEEYKLLMQLIIRETRKYFDNLSINFKLSEDQIEKIIKYLRCIDNLLFFLELNSRINKATRTFIEETLFLPISEVEKLKQFYEFR